MENFMFASTLVISTKLRRWMVIQCQLPLLVDAAARHQIISFMDDSVGYNQIFMAEKDIPKTAFRCLCHVGLFEWIVISFGLKNAGATY